MAHSSEGSIFLGDLVEDGLVVETLFTGPDVVLLAHLEIFPEVLVTAPPVEVDHTQAFAPECLMEVGVPHVILLSISWETSVSDLIWVMHVGLSNMPSPVLNHPLLCHLDYGVEQEGLIQVEAQSNPSEANSVLSMKRVHLPVDVSSGVLHQT